MAAAFSEGEFTNYQKSLWDLDLKAEAKSSPFTLHQLTTLQSDTSPSIPKQYVLPENFRPHVPHDTYTEGVPVIDLQNFITADYENLQSNHLNKVVAEALEEWRIFQMVNHGVPEEVISTFRAELARLFDLPYQQKMQGHVAASILGYSCNESTVTSCEKLPWSEAFTAMGSSTSGIEVREHASKIWPDDHDTFSCACERYGNCLKELAERMLQVLIRVLRVDARHFKELTKTASLALHANCYPICPEPHKTLGLGPHCDPGFFTLLLLDDNVGGLQIEKDGQWIAIKPVKGALTFLTGDYMEVISQGRFKATLHRAVTNAYEVRNSVSYMYAPTPTARISCPPELITPEQPQMYRPFTWTDILDIRRARAAEIHAGNLRIIDIFLIDSSSESSISSSSITT